MTDNKDLYLDAVLQVVYLDKDKRFWRKGSSFVIVVNEKIFIVTASHCIDEINFQDLFLSKLTTERRLFSIPIKSQIKTFDTIGTRVDTDLRILKVDDDVYNQNIIENAQLTPPEERYNAIWKTPFYKKLKRIYRNNSAKLIKKLEESKLYSTLTQKQNNEIYEKIKNADTSLAEIKNLKLADFCPKEKGKECFFIGYSIDKSKITCDDYGVFQYGHQGLMVMNGKLTGEFRENSGTYSLVYQTDYSLDGVSGGPVIADGKVIGVCSFIEEKNKTLFFIPVEEIKESIEFWFRQQNIPL